MGSPGSARSPETLPALLALVAAALGWVAMISGFLLGSVLGLRPTLVVSELLLVAPGLLVLVVTGIPLGSGLALRGRDRRSLLLSLAVGAALWVGSLGLLELQYAVWPPAAGYLEAFRRLHEALRPAGPLDALMSVLAIAVVPALCEETLARGIVLPALLRPLGAAGAVAVSSLVFASLHLPDTYRLPFTFAVGLALGVLRLRACALLPGMVAHASLNTLTFLAAPLLDDPFQPLPDPRPLLGAALFAVGGALTFLLMRLVHMSLTPGVGTPRLRS
jgi:membrane protease YdiL (CAAX protease family)